MSIGSDQNFEWTIHAAASGMRIDQWLDAELADLSRSHLRRLIDQGHVLRNDQPPKPHQKLQAGDHICLRLPRAPSALPQAEDLPLEVLYVDSDMLVINKSPDTVVHPAPGHESGTLVNALLFRYPDIRTVGDERRPGIVHRLDRDTSGLVVVARTNAASEALIRQFKTGAIKKVYHALVHGCPSPAEGQVETRIGRHAKDRKRMAVCEDHGKKALTRYRVEESFPTTRSALLRVEIDTGRTHQIRVHMAHIGHPVKGDKVYARRHPEPWPQRQMLHAAHLHFRHPASGKPVSFEAPTPLDMQRYLQVLRDAEV